MKICFTILIILIGVYAISTYNLKRLVKGLNEYLIENDSDEAKIKRLEDLLVCAEKAIKERDEDIRFWKELFDRVHKENRQMSKALGYKNIFDYNEDGKLQVKGKCDVKK